MIRELVSQILRSGEISLNAHANACRQVSKEKELDDKLNRCIREFNERTTNTSNERVLQFRSLKREIRKVSSRGIQA